VAPFQFGKFEFVMAISLTKDWPDCLANPISDFDVSFVWAAAADAGTSRRLNIIKAMHTQTTIPFVFIFLSFFIFCISFVSFSIINI
jgi:hypothetical protein